MIFPSDRGTSRMAESSTSKPPQTNPPEPLWPVVLAAVGLGGMYFALPEPLSLGPHWLLLVIIIVLIVLASFAHRGGRAATSILLGHVLSAVMTLFMFWSLALLLRALFAHKEPPAALLRAGALLWMNNVLVFASWYWRLDAGGPHARAKRLGHPNGAFLFPQMTMDKQLAQEVGATPWAPRFVDYLYLAFNTSTALSPTDTPVLSRWAKAMMMAQSVIALMVTLILVGRAVNIM